MNKYDEIVKCETKANDLIVELKNNIYKKLCERLDTDKIQVEMISNRKVCKPIITITFKNFKVYYSDKGATFDYISTSECNFREISNQLDEIGMVLDTTIYD